MRGLRRHNAIVSEALFVLYRKNVVIVVVHKGNALKFPLQELHGNSARNSNLSLKKYIPDMFFCLLYI